MMRSLGVAFLFMAAVLAGCTTGPAASADHPEDVFARQVTFNLQPDAVDSLDNPSDLMKLFSTQYEYTQPSGSLDVAGVSVETTTPDGQRHAEPLSSYTSQSTVHRGDHVTIPVDSPMADIRFVRDGKTIQERHGATPDWLHYGDAPLPVAAAPGGLAHYTFSSDTSAQLTLDHAGYDAGAGHASDSSTVSNVNVDGRASLSGTFDIDATGSADHLKLALAATLAGNASLDASATVTENGHTDDVGVKANVAASADGKVEFGFRQGQLSTVGGTGSVKADGSISVRGPGDATYNEPPGIRHPFVDTGLPEVSMPVPNAPDVPAKIVKLLEGIYGVTLVPGDSFQFTIHNSDVRFDETVRVAARQSKVVAGETRSALKLVGNLGFALGSGQTLFASDYTYYIDEATMLPLLLESNVAHAYSHDDLAPIFDLVSQRVPGAILPDQVSIAFTGKSTLRLTSVHDELRVPGATQAYAFAMPVVVVAAAVTFVLVTKLSGNQQDSGEWASVSISSPTTGRVYITLVSGGQNAPYGADDVQLTLDGNPCPVLAGTSPTGASLQDSNGDGSWGAGETLVLHDDCAGTRLASGTTHLVSVTVHGTLLNDNTRVVVS